MNIRMKEPQQPAQASVIWMHGLGANASDMMGLVDQLAVDDAIALRHVFLDAPIRPVTINRGMTMPAWYDIRGMQLTDREDKEGIEQSAAFIRQVYEEQFNLLATQQVFLAGFSQGGAMALYTALQIATPVSGIIALSAYLPLASQCQKVLGKNTPMFIASGQYDSIVLPLWTQQTAAWLSQAGYTQLSFHNYPMEHSICLEEIRDLSNWLKKQVRENLE